MPTSAKQDYYELLGVDAQSERQGYTHGVSKAGAEIPSGSQSRRQSRRRKIQTAAGSVRRSCRIRRKRQMYDQYGFYSDNVPTGDYGPGPESGGENVNFDFGGFDFGGQQSGGSSFRDLFGQFFGGRRGGVTAEAEHEPGGDLEYQIEIDFWDAVRGSVKKLQITRLDTCETCHGTGAVGTPQTCPTCNGTGSIQQTAGKMRFNVPCNRCGGTGKLHTPCRVCGGEGRVRKTETIDVASLRAWQTVDACVCRERRNADDGSAPGDLYLRVMVRPHEFFERRGNDLYTKVPVTVPEASLARKIEVPTIDGRSLVRIPPGTNSGKTLRLKEKGVPSARNGARGDQYVEIQVVVPPPTDERVRNLMKELESVAPGDPRKDLFSKAGV